MAVTAAQTGYGTTLQLSDGGSPIAYTAIAEVVKVSGIGLERTVIEGTNLTSPAAFKEFVYGMKMSKEFSLEVNYLPTDSTQKDAIAGASNSSIARVWRLVLPDFGAVTKTFTVSTTTATSSAHGFLTGQSITVTSSGTIFAGLSLGQVYWIKRLSSSTFSVHNSPADAVAGSSAISMSGGSGTVTANATSLWGFTGECAGFTADAEPDAKLTGQIKFTITGPTTLTP